MQENFKSPFDPFSTFINPWTEKYSFAEGFNWDKIVAANRSNTKALTDIAQSISEGAQAMGRRQAEILQRNLDEAGRYLKDASSSERNPEVNITRQADFAKAAVDNAIASSRELLEIASKCQNETRDILSKRVSGVMSELSQVCNVAGKAEKNTQAREHTAQVREHASQVREQAAQAREHASPARDNKKKGEAA